MTLRALIKFAPVLTAEQLLDHDTVRAGRCLYQRGSLTLAPGKVELLVDHDWSRPVGYVEELVVHEDMDGPWWCARAAVTDPPPWLVSRETRASFGFFQLEDQQVGEWTRVLRGLVKEVSVLSPSRRPSEPRARVELLYRDEPPPPRARQPVGEVSYHRPAELLVRPNIGRVLAVR